MAEKIVTTFPQATAQYSATRLNELVRSLEQTVLQLNTTFSNQIPETELQRMEWFIS